MVRGGHKASGGSQTDSQAQKVLQVARKVAATIGADFFEATAKHLAKAVSADCVVIGEFLGGQVERVRTLGAWMDGGSANFEFELAGSASSAMAFGKTCQCHSEARTHFPADKLLAEVGADAVLGVPLLDNRAQATGMIAALYRHKIARLSVARQLLQIFSARAAAELNRKKQEDELRESDQRYRAFIASSADALWRVEFEKPIDTTLPPEEQLAEMYRYGYLAECNDAMATQLGLEHAEQLIGSRLDDIAPQSDPQIREANLRAIRTGYDFSTVALTRPDGRGRHVHLLRSAWGIVEDGMLTRIWGSTRDITDLKWSEEELDASERRMSRLLETMKLVVVIEDANGAITYCNRHFYQKTGWKVGAIKGKTWTEALAPPEERDKLIRIFEQARSKPENPVHFESALLGPDAQRWLFDWDRTVLQGAAGSIAAWASVGRDVTNHKTLEGQLRQAQKLATIGKVAGGVAHDFNNLLTVILGYSARLLENREHLNPDDCNALEEIRKAASKGASLTHQLLAFGRRQILRPETVSLNLLISDSVHMLRTLIGEDVHLITKLEPSAGLVRIDSSSFLQILMNLAVNARDAMPHGGKLVITTANCIITGSEAEKLVTPGEYVEITVSDSGVGMTDEIRDHLFEPFFTTKEPGKGSGLGLSMVYGIVQQSGGTISVDSELDKGTTFRICFPRVRGAVQTADPDPAVAVKGGSETVLLVEDRKDVRKFMTHALRELGYCVLEADGPERALEIGLDRGRHIHLLLTDVVMPGMNGLDLADRIRTLHNEVKVLFISGHAEPDMVSEKLTQPGYAFLQKPFAPRALAESMRGLLDRG